jgi:hypothetical protein
MYHVGHMQMKDTALIDIFLLKVRVYGTVVVIEVSEEFKAYILRVK